MHVNTAAQSTVVSPELASSVLGESFRAFIQLKKPRIILGSQSYSRKLILDEGKRMFGFEYECCSADIDEKAIRLKDPEELVIALAKAKSHTIISKLMQNGADKQKLQNAYLITGDQVVVHDGNILEKPESEEEARTFISGYSTSPPMTVGSVMVTKLDKHMISRSALDTASAHFNAIPTQIIDKLVEEGSVFRCAGGLMVENPLVVPYRVKIEGGMDSIMGMKLETVIKLMLEVSEQSSD